MKPQTDPGDPHELLHFMTKAFGIALVACLAICLYDLKTIDSQLDSLSSLAANLEDGPGTEPSPDPEPTNPTPDSPSTSVATPPHLGDCLYPRIDQPPLPTHNKVTNLCIQHIRLERSPDSPDGSKRSTAKLSFSIRNLAKGQKISGYVAVVLRLVDANQKTISTLSFPSNFIPFSHPQEGPEERLVFQALNYSPKSLTFAIQPGLEGHKVQADFFIQLVNDPALLVFNVDKIPINTAQYHGDPIN